MRRTENPEKKVQVLLCPQSNGAVVQWSEHPAVYRKVVSSSLTSTANWEVAQWSERVSYTHRVTGSNPVFPTKIYAMYLRSGKNKDNEAKFLIVKISVLDQNPKNNFYCAR